MPSTWREAVISIISKEGKDRSESEAYRPISVVNVDDKLLTAILAILEKILPQLIQYMLIKLVLFLQRQHTIIVDALEYYESYRT